MLSKKDWERVLAVIADPAGHGIAKCTLCGAAPTRTGVFLPTNQEFARRIGQPQGKIRFCLYGLCEACYALPSRVRNQRVEAGLLDSVENPILFYGSRELKAMGYAH